MKVKYISTEDWLGFELGGIYDVEILKPFEPTKKPSWFVYVEGSKLFEIGGRYGYHVHDHQDYFEIIKEKYIHTIDMSGGTCEECGIGYYKETRFFDDMDGVLHCPECGHQVNRYREEK